MEKTILLKKDEYVFSYRVAGVLIKEGKILVQNTNVDYEYGIPGGHVDFGETNAQTLIREFKEELNVEIRVGNLKYVGEIFFPWGDKRCHQICLYYDISLVDDDSIPFENGFGGIEKNKDQSSRIKFSWFPINKIMELALYPLEIKRLIHENTGRVEHFVWREES